LSNTPDFLNLKLSNLQNKIHPDVALDDIHEVIDEPNYNNFNTSPDPPSPYADLEKKYRKNKFNRARKTGTTSLYGTAGPGPSSGSKVSGNKVQKRKNSKPASPKPSTRPSRPSNGKRTP
jgi:hypothetical protein